MSAAESPVAVAQPALLSSAPCRADCTQGLWTLHRRRGIAPHSRRALNMSQRCSSTGDEVCPVWCRSYGEFVDPASVAEAAALDKASEGSSYASIGADLEHPDAPVESPLPTVSCPDVAQVAGAVGHAASAFTLLLAPGCAVTLTNVCITPKEQHQHSTSLLAAGCKVPDIYLPETAGCSRGPSLTLGL